MRLTVEFHDYLTGTPPWPQFPDDPFHDMTYKDEFMSRYHTFLAQTDFETKCRLLLDLFKLQIVFAGPSMIACHKDTADAKSRRSRQNRCYSAGRS